jgi:monoamine oxidase
MSENNHVSTVIVGAGVAGLAAAKILYANNIRFLLVEAQDYVGGRVRSVHAGKINYLFFQITRKIYVFNLTAPDTIVDLVGKIRKVL